MILRKTLLFRRWCPRRPWRGNVPMVAHPGQKVSHYGYYEHGHVADAECTACGGTHGILGWFTGLIE